MYEPIYHNNTKKGKEKRIFLSDSTPQFNPVKSLILLRIFHGVIPQHGRFSIFVLIPQTSTSVSTYYLAPLELKSGRTESQYLPRVSIGRHIGFVNKRQPIKSPVWLPALGVYLVQIKGRNEHEKPSNDFAKSLVEKNFPLDVSGYNQKKNKNIKIVIHSSKIVKKM